MVTSFVQNNCLLKIILGRIFGINATGSNYYFTGIFADSLCLDIDTIVSVNSTYDAFIYATNTDLEGQWVRTVSGFGNEYLYSVSTFSDQTPVISGYSNSSVIQFDSTSNDLSLPLTNHGGYDIFLSRYDLNGNLIDKKNFGGPSDENTYFSTVINDEINLTGFTTGASYWDSDTIYSHGTIDKSMIYAKIDSNLNVSLTRQINSTVPNSSERGQSLVGYNGKLYIVGTTTADSIAIGDSIYYNLEPGFDKTFIVELGCLSITPSITTPSDLSCYGDSNASLNFIGTGGFSQNYLYSINNGTTYQDSGAFHNLAAGDYKIMMMDSVGCVDSTDIITITQPDQLEITSVDSVDVSAYQAEDGEVIVDAAGGTTPYTFTLNGDNPQDNGTYTGLPVGKYLVALDDANNCGPRRNGFHHDQRSEYDCKIRWRHTQGVPQPDAWGTVYRDGRYP